MFSSVTAQLSSCNGNELMATADACEHFAACAVANDVSRPVERGKVEGIWYFWWPQRVLPPVKPPPIGRCKCQFPTAWKRNGELGGAACQRKCRTLKPVRPGCYGMFVPMVSQQFTIQVEVLCDTLPSFIPALRSHPSLSLKRLRGVSLLCLGGSCGSCTRQRKSPCGAQRRRWLAQ